MNEWGFALGKHAARVVDDVADKIMDAIKSDDPPYGNVIHHEKFSIDDKQPPMSVEFILMPAKMNHHRWGENLPGGHAQHEGPDRGFVFVYNHPNAGNKSWLRNVLTHEVGHLFDPKLRQNRGLEGKDRYTLPRGPDGRIDFSKADHDKYRGDPVEKLAFYTGENFARLAYLHQAGHTDQSVKDRLRGWGCRLSTARSVTGRSGCGRLTTSSQKWTSLMKTRVGSVEVRHCTEATLNFLPRLSSEAPGPCSLSKARSFALDSSDMRLLRSS